MGQSIVEIIIKASNQASGEFKKAFGDLGALGKEAEKMGKGMRSAGLAITGGVTTPLVGFIATSAVAAARVDGLKLANNQLAQSAGYTEQYVQAQAQSVKKMGIEHAAAQQIVAKFMTAQLDLADASNLARIAQDQAVISGENSTETMTRLTDALITGNSQMFRSMNMTLDLSGAYEAMAVGLGKNVDELSETERVQARVNAVMEYGTTIAGTYEAAMGDSFKQMGSFKRMINDIAVEAGQYFTPALNTAVFGVKDLLGTVSELISEGGALEPVLAGWGEKLNWAAGLIGTVDDGLKKMKPSTAGFIGDMTAATAVMGPLLLVGGQTVIWATKLADALKTSAGGLGIFAVGIYAVTAAMIHQANERKALIADHEEMAQSALNASGSYEEYRAAMAGVEQQIDNLAGVTGGYGVHLANTLGETIILTEAQWEQAKAHVELAKGMAASDAHMMRMAGNMVAYTNQTQEATEATEAHERALNRAAVRAKEYGGASDTARTALEKLGVAAEEQSRLLDELNDSTENLNASDLLLVELNTDLTKLWAENALSTDSYNAALEFAHKLAEDYPEKLSPVMEMFGEWGSKVQNISDLLHGIPSFIKVDILQTWYEAQGGVWKGSGNIGAGQNNPDTTADTFATATGGPVYPGQVYRWREFGDEYFIPDQRGSVIPHRDVEKVRSGNGGPMIVNVTINTPFNMADAAFVERAMGPIIQRQMREAIRA
jgi:chemotaxis regulatin CheY-phosphate phosphatase CheZ